MRQPLLHRLIPLLLVGGVVLVFSPTIGAELLAVDDAEMYDWLMHHAGFDLVGIFVPGSSGGGYYRPLIALSFLLDRALHGGSLPVMHAVNILIHAVNASLVYQISRRLLSLRGGESPLFPAVAASLIFGLHPLATESVAWLSGRTDPLSILFMLIGTLFLLDWGETGKRGHLLGGVMGILCGILTKESVLAALPAALLVVSGPLRERGDEHLRWRFHPIEFLLCTGGAILSVLYSFNILYPFLIAFLYLFSVLLRHRHELPPGASFSLPRQVAAGGVLLVSPALLFLVIRRVAFASDTGKLAETIRVMLDDPNYTFMTFLGALGFYVKKFLVPIPLNFAIREIDPLYQLIGIGVMLLSLFLLLRRTLVDRLVVAGVIMLLPSFLISFGTIAWTAYAERYVYPSLPFWSVAAGTLLSRLEQSRMTRLPLILLLIFAFLTVDRSLTWRTNYTLFRDTVQKTPSFRTIRETYMAVLMNRGDFAQAREQYDAGKKIVTVGYDPQLDINMAELLRREGKQEESWSLIETIIEKSRGGRVDVIQRYLQQMHEVVAKGVGADTRSRLLKKMIRCRELLFFATDDPIHLYLAGKLSLERSDRYAAARYFLMASEIFPPGDPFQDISRRFGRRLLSIDRPQMTMERSARDIRPAIHSTR
ncbi:MAG: hypothetical protein Fur0034_05150 [Desulfuromonadia bacterium]